MSAHPPPKGVAARLARDRSGVTALEFGMVGLPLILFLFGVIETGMAIRMKSALQFAATNAARCAAINTVTCGTDANIKAYAMTQTQGVTVPASAFTVSSPSCGRMVVASMAFPVTAPQLLRSGLVLSAQACYPLRPT